MVNDSSEEVKISWIKCFPHPICFQSSAGNKWNINISSQILKYSWPNVDYYPWSIKYLNWIGWAITKKPLTFENEKGTRVIIASIDAPGESCVLSVSSRQTKDKAVISLESIVIKEQ